MKTTELSCAFIGYIYDESLSYKVTLIIVATVILIMAAPTILLNMCIMKSILRESEFHTPSFVVILNLAISDCLAGCSAYILHAITCISFASGYNACPVAYIAAPLSFILITASFNTITLQTIERYLAIFFPYWYHQNFTVKRIIMGIVAIWILSIAMVAFWVIRKDNQVYHGTFGSISLLLFTVTLVLYIRIFREVRRIEKEMMTRQTASYEDRKKIKSDSKVAKATLIILLAVATCYSPGICLNFYCAISGAEMTSMSVAIYWVWLLAMLNSFVNPLIVCRQLTVLRRPVIGLLFRMFPCFKSHNVTPLMNSTSLVIRKVLPA